MNKRKGNMMIFISMSVTLVLYIFSKTDISFMLFSPWLSISQILALVGTVLLAWTFILSSRGRFLESWFGGLDRVSRIHHVIGGLSFVMLLHHPLFLAINALTKLMIASRYLWWSEIDSHNYGVVALYVMIITLILTFIIKLPYNWWIKTHDFMGISLFFACLHIFFISSDVSRFWPLRVWIFSWLAIAVYAFVYKIFLYKNFGPKYIYKVKKVKKFGEILEIYLAPKKNKLDFLPGQFGFVSFDDNKLREPHPFSFASSPEEQSIRLGIKIVGDYTNKLVDLKKGTTATIMGGYGKLSERFYEDKEIICIAGGIGITPFLSMLGYEEKHKLNRKIHLFYCNKSKSEAIYDQELADMEKNVANFEYHPWLGNKKLRITADAVCKIVGSLDGKLFFLCGPTGMMSSLSGQFQLEGVKKKDIIFEDFNLKT